MEIPKSTLPFADVKLKICQDYGCTYEGHDNDA